MRVTYAKGARRELDAAEIRQFPLAAPAWDIDPAYRVRTLTDYHYRIFYRVIKETIRIYAIAHTWLDRLK